MMQNPLVNDTFTQTNEKMFYPEEIFFSRTNKLGIIESGNDVFQRISGYEWSEIIGKPHKIVRHPDMPKAVFYILWDYLKHDKPVAAYVKNKTKQGEYYWVLAIATPIQSGYLSVRIKPSSTLLNKIKCLYTAIRQKELGVANLNSEDSYHNLLNEIITSGFDDYDEFMAHALAYEFLERQHILNRNSDVMSIKNFLSLSAHAKDFIKETNVILSSYNEAKFIPMNLYIAGAKLKEEGKKISTIASVYKTIAKEIHNEISQFEILAQDVSKNIHYGLFTFCVSRVQKDVLESFKSSVSHYGDMDLEMSILQIQSDDYLSHSKQQIKIIIQSLEMFLNKSVKLKQVLINLEAVRILGKMEAVHLGDETTSLNGLMESLWDLQQIIKASINTIEMQCHQALDIIKSI